MEFPREISIPHVALNFPEILAKVMTFLPKPDLITCTLVNSGFAAESRERLLSTESVVLNAIDILSMDIMERSCPQNVSIHEQMTPFPHIMNYFISNNGTKVKHLSTYLPLDGVTIPQYFHYLSTSFPNLTTLKMEVTNSAGLPPNLFIPSEKMIRFRKISKVGIKIRQPLTAEHYAKLGEIMAFFPNLVTLACEGIYSSFPGILIRPKSKIVPFTRLELAAGDGITPLISQLLTLSAPTLERLKFFHLANFPSHHDHENDAVFPVMPKLKVFTIVQSPTRGVFNGCSNFMPALRFKFGRFKSDKLVYQDQFPALEKISICPDRHVAITGSRYFLSRLEYFEMTARFLYNSFLREGNSCGVTVKELDVPFPPGDKFSVIKKKISSGSCTRGPTGLCECGEERDSSEFWDRVAAIFPNLVGYAAMGGSLERARVEMGEELGFIKGEGGEGWI
ncbi:hypothetical protein Fcan01_15975 [Folsomia candida]|uniref:F-box domain-containing protein n=1 Tax=Folsomia candida TaxID=158441 RepID=A0A226DW89_FOLCA|nr:hypothetical protein Fcan01_15975 [Folsomia candida]